MSTKCTVFGQPDKPRERKPIELLFGIETSDTVPSIFPPGNNPKPYDTYTLVERGGKYDIIRVYNDSDPLRGITYLGHWNDGFVE